MHVRISIKLNELYDETSKLRVLTALLNYMFPDNYKIYTFKEKSKIKIMAEERTGAMTPEQEKILDQIVELKGIAEALDGPVITLIDNQGIERLLQKTSPETRQIVYEVVDIIFEGLAVILEK